MCVCCVCVYFETDLACLERYYMYEMLTIVDKEERGGD